MKSVQSTGKRSFRPAVREDVYKRQDINGVSCKDGEVEASVFDRYRDPLYKEASYKPYVIAAMIMLAKFADPAEILKKLEEKGTPRVFK